ncbi:M6 family metalloprotease domain-containing protein [Gemmatimonadota bacterium]
MGRIVTLITILIVLLAHAPLSATTIPPDGKFPAGFWSDILSGRDSLRYGDPGWIKRMGERRAIREQIAAGRTTLAALDQAQFTMPVLLGRYSDATTVYDSTDFNKLLFGDNPTGSFVDYYNEISLGQFQVDGESFGWYTVNNQAAYNDGTDTGDSDSFVYHVVSTADGEVDYSLYDNDGPDGLPNSGDDDGYVDGVIVVYSGVASYQVEDGDTPNLWPVSSNLDNEYVTGDMSVNGGSIKVSAYAIGPELYDDGIGNFTIHPIGVFAHEFGHVLGMPDLYDYTDDTQPPDFDDSEGLGQWCLMASGSWGGDGNHAESPAHMSAWCKMNMGWVTPQTIEQEGQYTLASEAGEVYRLWADGNRMTSYFLVENRQQEGFDEYLEGAGLLIYHVDEIRWWGLSAYSSGVNNNDETHKLVDLEAADGLLDLDNTDNRADDGDPWPGSAGNRSFSTFSVPSSVNYDGTPTGVTIENISDPGAVMSAYFRPASAVGYGIAYDEQGISGWGWGHADPADYWSGVLFTTEEEGKLEALDIGFRDVNSQITVQVYSTFESSFSGSFVPSGLLATFDDTLETSGWYTIRLPEAVQLAAGQDFFVSVLIYGQAYSVSYDRNGVHSGRSYTSGEGEFFFDNISTSATGGDINIRARIRTVETVGEPLLAISTDSIAFGAVGTGTSATRTFQVYNLGDGDLSATLQLGAAGAFEVSPGSATVAPGDSQEIAVTFAPTLEGSYDGTVTVTSVDTSLTVALSGSAAALSVFKTSIGDETFTETTGSYELWVELNPVIDNPLVEIAYSLDGETISGGVECVLVDGRYVGSLPAQPLNSTILYYFIVSGDGEELYTLPAGAPLDSYKVTVALEKPGDLDGDWRVSIFDLLDMLSYLGQPDGTGAGDVNADGKVDIFDLLEVLRLMARD